MGQRVRGLYPHVSGRGQEISVRVRAVGGLSSRSEGAVLNGANVALFKAGVGGKVFLEAAVVDDQTYKLSGLLGGQQGSEDALAAGAAAGPRSVFLTGAERRLEAADWELGAATAMAGGSRIVCRSAVWNADYSQEAAMKSNGEAGMVALSFDGEMGRGRSVADLDQARPDRRGWLDGRGADSRMPGGLSGQGFCRRFGPAMGRIGSFGHPYGRQSGHGLFGRRGRSDRGGANWSKWGPGPLDRAGTDDSCSVTDRIVVFRLNIPIFRLVLDGREGQR